MPEISYAKGQILLLNDEALDPATGLKFKKGTEVVIRSVTKQGVIEVEFPNKCRWFHNWTDIVRLFSKKNTTHLSSVKQGSGTPPKEFFNYLPKGSDWKKKYIWKVFIELEEIGDKAIVCPICSSEIIDLEKSNDTGDLFCTACNTYVSAFDLRTNSLFNNFSKNKEIVSDKEPLEKE